jgi:hypothetical protein
LGAGQGPVAEREHKQWGKFEDLDGSQIHGIIEGWWLTVEVGQQKLFHQNCIPNADEA